MYINASAPEAPPLSVTTTGCFIRLFFWIAACIIRAIWSEAPPAPAATTISTGLVGSQAASAWVVAKTAAVASATRVKYLRIVSSCRYPAILTRWHTGPLAFLSYKQVSCRVRSFSRRTRHEPSRRCPGDLARGLRARDLAFL